MRHPAQTLKFFVIAVVATALGLVIYGFSVTDAEADLSGLGSALGLALLAIGLINFAVHAVAVLLYDHEMWRSTHFTEVVETDG